MTYISQSSNFALYLDEYLVNKHYTFGLSQYDLKFDFKIVGHSDIFHGSVILLYILKKISYIDITLADYESV